MGPVGLGPATYIIRALMGTSAVPPSPSAAPEPVAGRAEDPFIFVLGHERSGTTMLRAMLDSHPDLAVPPEAHSVVHLLGHQVRPLDLDEILTAFAHDKYFADWQLAPADLEFLRTDPRVRTRADAIAGLYAAYARAHDKPRVADKTPSHLAEMQLLAERFPNAKFLHIVRDGRDVAASMVTMNFGSSEFAHAARIWRLRIVRAHELGRSLGPDRYCEIHYEDLVADPVATLQAACAFLDLPYDDAMLRYHERAEELLDGVRHTHHIQGIRRPPTRGLRDWHVDVSPHDLAVFDEIAGEALDVLGYPRSGLRRSRRAQMEATRVNVRMRARRIRRVYSRRIGRRVRALVPGRTDPGATPRPAADRDPPPGFVADPPDLDLSVVIPVHDAGATIDAQLTALTAEVAPVKWEIVVVDNGSHDGTVGIVEQWAARDPRVRLVHAADVAGAAHARNAGGRVARGRNLAFCDGDDIVAVGWVAAMAAALDVHEFVGGPVELHRLNPPWLVTAKGTTGTDGLVWFDDLFPFASSCNLGIRRDQFLARRGFDETLTVAEDVELAMRLHLAGITLHYEPAAAVHYRYRQTRTELYTRARAYGAGRPLIAERFRAATGTQPARFQGWRNWAWLVRHLGLLGTRTGQARWLWTAGGRVGSLRGSWTVRRLYL